MSNTIDQYREAKNSYLKLRNQAKKELIARFHEVANEMLQIQRELLEDFGEKVPLPTKGKKPKPVKKVAADSNARACGAVGKGPGHSKATRTPKEETG